MEALHSTKSSVIHRDLRHAPPVAARAEGVRVWDASGKRYLDATSGGVAVSCLGYGNSEVKDAIVAQLRDCAYIHSSFFTTVATEELAEFLTTRAPGDLSSVCFVGSGSEATDTALKMARQYFLEIGRPERRKIIARRQSYHGATIGALSVGGNKKRRGFYEPYLFDVDFVEPCYAYRGRHEGESVEDFGLRVANTLEAAILRAGPETVAAFIAEPVVGATLGCVPAVPGYLRRIREICDRYGVLLILDEVMCGMGRTGYLFTCEEDEVVPDLLTAAKGLGGGFQPIGVVFARHSIVEAIAAGSGALMHGYTYMGHAAACAGSLAVQRIIDRDRLLAQVRERGVALRTRLDETFGQHPLVGDIRGRGLFLGLEFVADRATKASLDPEMGYCKRLKQAALSNGLMVYALGGTIDGVRGDHVVLSPAFTVSCAEIDEIVDRLATSIEDATP